MRLSGSGARPPGLLAASPRLCAARPSSSTRLRLPQAQVHHSVDDPPLERLELLFAASPLPPPPAHLDGGIGNCSQAPPAALAAQQQQQQHGHHTTEVCGHSGSTLNLCVEHELDEAGADLGAVASEPAPGMLGRLLDMVPLSKRSRGIVMLNLLVLLVATNWVSGLCAGLAEGACMRLRPPVELCRQSHRAASVAPPTAAATAKVNHASCFLPMLLQVVVKDVGATFDPYGFAFLRFAVAALAFAPFLKVRLVQGAGIGCGAQCGRNIAAGTVHCEQSGAAELSGM